MAWNRNAPDPLEARRRQLAEAERLLAEQRERLREQLHQASDPASNVKPVEPPVWRLEDDARHERTPDPTPARRRNLARQRRRDMFLFFLFIGLLFIVLVVVLLVYVHNAAPATGA